jgi:dihydrofolate reductase
VEIGGPGLAAAAIAEDLIDEYCQFVYPIILGAGTPYFPPVTEPLGLRLVETRSVGSQGVVYLRYERAR